MSLIPQCHAIESGFICYFVASPLELTSRGETYRISASAGTIGDLLAMPKCSLLHACHAQEHKVMECIGNTEHVKSSSSESILPVGIEHNCA
jgi:hypothetical protein